MWKTCKGLGDVSCLGCVLRFLQHCLCIRSLSAVVNQRISIMDKCTKFKLFIVLLVLCVINVFAYRFFSRPDLSLVESSFVTSKPILRISSSNASRDLGANHTADTIAVIRLDKDIIPHEIPTSPVLETTSKKSEDPKTLPLCPLVPPSLSKFSFLMFM